MEPTIPTTVFGLLTVIILTLLAAIRRQYRDSQLLQEKYNALQEARRVDAKETNDKVTQPLQGISQTLGLIYDKIRASKESV